MKRLFLTISTGVLIAIALTGLVTRLLSIREFEAHQRQNPPPFGSVVGALAVELLQETPEEQRDAVLARLEEQWGVGLRIIPADRTEAVLAECEHCSELMCWGCFGHQGLDVPKLTIVVKPTATTAAIQVDERRPGGPPGDGSWVWTVVTMFAVAMVAGALLAYPVVRRLRTVQETAQRLEEGDLSARASVSSHDAVGIFASRFNRMAETLQQLIEGQTQMFQAVAHELRTPIARIHFGLEMLASAQDEAKRELREGQIRDDLDELERLTDEILLLIRASTPNARLARERIRPADVVEEEIDRIRPLYADKAIRLEVVPAGDGVYLHRRSFARVVHNLLSNAARHAAAHVAVAMTLEEDVLTVSVRDDGPGIPPEERAQVLQPFYRLDRSRSRDSGGVGLGLAIVDRLVRAHGGEVIITEGSDGGTVVTTRWPGAADSASGDGDDGRGRE